LTEQISTKIENKVFHIILNRPEKKNALTKSMYRGLADALIKAENDKNINVMLLYGNGDSFCAGNDLKDFQDINYFNTEERPSADFLSWLINAKKPIIGAVCGYAIGVGTTMLLNCDLLYSAEDAKFQFPFTNLGLIPEYGSTFNLPELVGKFRAAELLFFGNFFTAEEALKMGMINKVFPKSKLIDKATIIAEQLAERPPIALRSTKMLMKMHHKRILEKLLPEEGAEFVRRQVSSEAQEAFLAFFEGRKTDFSKFG
jgi:enoyl-CoA hydratase/carnithine racemase